MTSDEQTVLDHVVVGELAERVDSNAGVAQDFDGRPRPERPVLFQGEIAAFGGVAILRPDVIDATRRVASVPIQKFR